MRLRAAPLTGTPALSVTATPIQGSAASNVEVLTLGAAVASVLTSSLVALWGLPVGSALGPGSASAERESLGSGSGLLLLLAR